MADSFGKLFGKKVVILSHNDQIMFRTPHHTGDNLVFKYNQDGDLKFMCQTAEISQTAMADTSAWRACVF